MNDSATATQAKEAIAHAQDAGRDFVRTQLDNRSTMLGKQIGSFANDLRSVGDGLRTNGGEGAAALSEQLAGYVERLGTYLQSSDADRLLDDVETWARRAPAAVAVGGVLIGFAASRLLKISATQRYRTRYTDSGSYGTSTYRSSYDSSGYGSRSYTPTRPTDRTSAAPYRMYE